MRWLIFLIFLGGCTLRFEVVTMPDPETVAWEKRTSAWQDEATKRINDHDSQIKALEERVGRWDAREGDI